MTTAQKYALLLSVFEEVLRQHIVLSELRDFYRSRAGLETKSEGDE